MPSINLPNGWEPRQYQRGLWTELENGARRVDIAAHRRWGKDDIALHWGAVSAFTRVGTYWHMLPEAAQARKAIWDAINPHTGKRRIDEAFPAELRDTTREQDMLIRFRNGSTWQVVGSDNYNSLVGSPPVGVTFSEWSLARPEAWAYIRPILLENGGWALFIWTPRGRNHAVRSFESRERSDGWLTLRSPANETGVFTPEDLARERQELIDETGSEEEGDAKFRQEYLVDFNVPVPGSYYGSVLAKADDEGRIGDFPHDPDLPVHTSWDIGVDDYTAVWFFQENAGQVRAIGYYEINGVGADYIVNDAINPRKANGWKFGRHYLPHDVKNREWGGGAKSRRQTLMELGVSPVMVGVAQNPAERINAARRLMPVISFDAKACAHGLDRLRGYRRSWNASQGVYGPPLKDGNDHGADAFGEYAVNCPIRPKPQASPTTTRRNDYSPMSEEAPLDESRVL